MKHFKNSDRSPFSSARPLHLAVALALCALGANSAYATCTGQNTASVTCSGTDSGNFLSTFGDDATINATNWTLSNGYFQGNGGTTGHTVKFIGDNVTVINGSAPGYGVLHLSAANGGDTDMKVSNSIIGSTGTHALASHANSAAGNAKLEVNNTAVNLSASASGGRGVIVRANGSGSSTLNVNGGSVTTANSSGSAVNALSGTGNVSATLSGGTVTSTGSNAIGLEVTTGGAGTVDVDNGDSITTSGSGSHGIYTAAVNGDTTVVNSGAIKTNNAALANGIFSQTSGTGDATISNSGDITISGTGTIIRNEANGGGNATIKQDGGNLIVNGALTNGAVYAYTVGAGKATVEMTGGTLTNNSTDGRGHGLEAKSAGSGGSSVTMTMGSVTTQGGYGIAAWNEDTGTGDMQVTTSAGTVVNATTANGIYSKSAGTGNITVDSQSAITAGGVGIRANSTGSGNVKVTQRGGDINSAGIGISASSGGAIDINNSSAIRTLNGSASGIQASSSGAQLAKVVNSGTINTASDSSHGLFAQASGNGAIDIDNSGVINTRGNAGHGINAQSAGNGNVTVNNSNSIATGGNQADGINAASAGGLASIVNSSQINTLGNNARGINVSDSGSVSVTNTGHITTSGSTDAAGVMVNTINASITSDISGNITTAGTYSPAVELLSGRNAEGAASSKLYYHDGTATVGAGSNAISLWSGGAATGSGNVHIGANTLIDASHGLSAVQNLMPEDGQITIDAGARILGGSNANNAGIPGAAAAGIDLTSARGVLSNSGDISAMNDRAISNSNGATQSMSLDNRGTVTGNITLAAGSNSLDNTGTWNLRNFADTDGDQTRDTLSVAVSDFGASGNNTVTNRGVIALLGDNGQAVTLNNSGEYATGYAANTMAIGGAAQGQILNVKTFTNSGTIDMGPANAAVGDVLVISGGNTPGVSGGGTYVTNGGKVILDTVLNAGGSNSQSDMLVVDGTQLGGAADKITVINAGGSGALTQANGIELVRVLDSSRSAAGAFKLDGRQVAGIYEYDLYQGGVGADAGDGNWYLRTLSLPPDPGPNPNPGPNPGPQPKPAPRPETGVYLRNMAAASGMFMHTLHDRLGEPQYTDKYQAETDGKVTSLWARVVGNHSDGKAANGEIDMSTDTSLIHLGGDLARWSNDGKDRWQFGLMGAYGQSDTDADPVHYKTTPSGYKRTANGKVDGYGLGAYLTWYGNKDKPSGPYVDLWTMYGWYNNKVKGNMLAEEKYDSTNWTTSIEGGYAFVAHDGEQRQWMIEPQAQLAYNSYSADNHREANGTWVTDGDQDGIVTRLGARAYSRSKLGDNGMQPFVEANWWHGTAQNSLRFNGEVVNDGTPKDTYELKAGLQGEIAKNWQLWGHVGGRWGQNSYSSYEGMLGVKYQF